MTPWKIKRRYQGRIMRFLKAMKAYLEDQGICCDNVFYREDEDDIWEFTVGPEPVTNEGSDTRQVDISFTIVRSETYGDKGGVTFKINIVAWGGRILGGCSPFNYTEQCWVPRKFPDKIEERFRLLEELKHEDIPPLLHEFWDRGEDE